MVIWRIRKKFQMKTLLVKTKIEEDIEIIFFIWMVSKLLIGFQASQLKCFMDEVKIESEKLMIWYVIVLVQELPSRQLHVQS